MLISAVMPIMSVYRLPQGQYGYSGHVVNLPQDVTSFVQSLPRLPSNLDVIIVRKEGANQSHRDFRVRRGVVHRALHSTDANRRDFTILSLCTSHHIKFIIIALSSYLLCTECAERQLVLKVQKPSTHAPVGSLPLAKNAKHSSSIIVGERERANLVVQLARFFYIYIYIYILGRCTPFMCACAEIT